MPRRSRDYERTALDAGLVRVDTAGAVWKLRRAGLPCAPYRAESQRRDGYLAVPLFLDGRRVRLLAHRLVYEARVGPIPEGHRVRQRNGDRSDNRPSNLMAVPATAPPVRRAATGASDATGVSGRSGSTGSADE